MAKKIPPKPTHRKRSPFYWWRRFPTHQMLHHYKPLIERIQNGDFDYPPYFEQAEWEDHWAEEEVNSIRHLFKDSQKASLKAGLFYFKDEWFAQQKSLLNKKIACV